MERSKAKSRRPVREGRRLERADPVGGPVGEEGASDDPLLGNWTPVSAVVALPTVVAHHKKVVRRNLDGLPQIAEFIAGRALCDERLLLLDERPGSALGEVDVVVLDLDPIARERYDALDEVVVRLVGRRLLAGAAVRGLARDPALLAVRALRRLEDDYVAPARIAEVRAEAVHENALADLECRDHRRARDPERLDEESLDADREAERDGDDHDELDGRVARALLPLSLLGLVHGRHDGPTSLRAPSGAGRLGLAGLGLAGLGLACAAFRLATGLRVGRRLGSISRAGLGVSPGGLGIGRA